ncbi:hypothetical protein LEN26_011097 [Aphanomyces euteiches]|nr:hypothetical protein AeMF1_010664 [Aphanomyces euteiches]KAH9120436.1 hypothetical protein LEN26_011097 [Aphanomyces euteiches]
MNDDEESNFVKDTVIMSPQVLDLHLQAEDFGQFDGPELSLWHLRQLLTSIPRTARVTAPPMPLSALHAASKQSLQQMNQEEGVRLVNVSFTTENQDHDQSQSPVFSDADFRLFLTPESTIYLSHRKYRVVICLDASPSTLSIDPITGKLILDVGYQSIEVLLRGLVQQRPDNQSDFVFPDIYLSVIVQGAMVDSLCVLAQGVFLHMNNVDDVLKLVKVRLQILEDHWAESSSMSSSSPLMFLEPTSLSTLLQNATFALNSLPHEASPMLFLVTDGVVDLPDMYAYDDLMMQLARHNIQCHAIQIGGGYMPHCSFGYVPDTDLLRFLTDATGGALFDLETLRSLTSSPSHPLLANSLQPVLFFKQSLIAPNKHAWNTPHLLDAIPLETQSFRPLRLFREKVHEYKMRGSVLKMAQARLNEGFFVAKFQMEPHIYVQCLLQWKPDIWLEYSITAKFMSSDMMLRVDVMAQAKFLEEFGVIAKRPASEASSMPVSATSLALHTFLKDLHERDRIMLHLISAIQIQTLDHDTKPIMHVFSRNTTAVTPAHPVFTLLGDLSPLLWHRWFHVERFELINLEWTKWAQAEPLVVDLLSRWATMQLGPNIYLKFLVAESYPKPNVNRKQRGSMIALSTPPTSNSGGGSNQKKSLCFVRVEPSPSGIVIIHVAFYSAKVGVRKSVLSELKRLLNVDTSGLIVSYRHIQRLLLAPITLTWLIEPDPTAAMPSGASTCCGGSGVSTPVFAASMWHAVWLWHIDEAHQQEAIRRLQATRQEQGLVVLQSSSSFVLLVQEVLVQNDKRTFTALFQCAISVVSSSTVMTSFWMEPVTGTIVSPTKSSQTPFGPPPSSTTKTAFSDTEWFEKMQVQLYQSDLHVLSCLLTFYSIVQATKEGVRSVAPPGNTLLPTSLNGLPVLNSPFSAPRLLTTCTPITERFLLYMNDSKKSNANRYLHDMVLESLLRLADCEVAWTESNPPPHVPAGPLWISHSLQIDIPETFMAPLTSGRCFAKVVGEYTMLLVFIPALETLPSLTPTTEPPEVESPDERLKWLAGLSSSVVAPETQRMATHDMAWFEQRKKWMEVRSDEKDVPFDVLPIQFYECSLVAKPSPTMDKSVEMENFVRVVKAAHEQNFSHGVYHALRSGASIQPCDLLQALWSCTKVSLDVDVTRLHAMLPLEFSAAPSTLDTSLESLTAVVLTPIPQTQWYYFTGDDADVASTFFVRFECWQDEEAWPSTDVRPRSKSVRVLGDSQFLSDVLKNMGQDRLPDPEERTLTDHVLYLSEMLKDVRYPRIYLRLVVMTLPENQEPKLPPVLIRLRSSIQELCAQHVLSILQCMPPLSIESPPLGALVQKLFEELPPSSVRRVQYPLSFLPLEIPGLPVMQLFHELLLSNHLLHLVRCGPVFFVIRGPDEPIMCWAFFSVAADTVSLNLHIPAPITHQDGVDELALLTKLHLGVMTSVTQVNQFLLLQQLHETRTCSPLLLAPSKHQLHHASSSGNLLESTTSNGFFWPGQFECPCKFKAAFILKARLNPTLTLNMLCTSALEQFQVHNRHHVFVYRDKRGHVFYMTLVETSTEKPTIELQVFGIREPGDDITVELCRVLEQKLDESLLNILMKAMPNMKASRSVSGSSRQNKLTTADFEFLVPDISKPTQTASFCIPQLDEHLFSYFVKEKLVETPYIRLAPPIDPVDASDSIKLADNSLLEDSASTLSFVINVNPELSGRSGFVASLGKGLAWVFLDVLDDSAYSGENVSPLAWSQVLSTWPNFSSSLSVRFRVFVRGQLSAELIHDVFGVAVQQALYEYAIESILRRNTQDTPCNFPVDVVRELRHLMGKASELSSTSITVMQQRDIIPSYDIEHVVKQLSVPFERLPSYVRPNVFYRSGSEARYEAYDAEATRAMYNFTDSFTLVCPMGVCSKFSFDDDMHLVKTLSASSLQSVDTNATTNSSPMVSPRHSKDVHDHDTMMHSSILSNPRHIFYQIELSHKGLVFAGYNCHPHVLDILSTGFAKAIGWCHLRQTLLRSILFQKRGYTLAAPTTCVMLQPSAIVLKAPIIQGKSASWTPRDFSSTLIAFTPQIFHVLLDNNNPPAVVSATLLRAIDGMGLAEYLRETGTPMEDIVTRPRVSSSTSEKVDQPTITMPPITPVGPTAPRPGVVNPPPMVSTRKAPVPPNATNALMAARARARGVVKAPPASTPSDDSSESKLPPAWSLTLNKDMLAPRTSLKVTPTAAATKTIAATKPSLPPRRQSNAEKIVAKGMSSKYSVWRHTLRTLLPSSFSHYNRNERDELLKASDPLSYHGIKLRSALDFHDAHRTSYNNVYDVFKSLLSQEDVGSISPFTLEKLLSCGRLMLHRYFSVSFTGPWPAIPPTVLNKDDAHGMLTLLSYEIQFIFNAVYAKIGRLHVDYLCQGIGRPSELFSSLIERVTAFQSELHDSRRQAFLSELIGHLKRAGFSALASRVYVKKETEGLVLIELSEGKTGMPVSLDAGRHLPQSSFAQLSGDQIVSTMSYVQSLLNILPMVYDFAVADMHAYLLRALSTTKDQLEEHLMLNPHTDLRHCTSAFDGLLATFPAPPSGAEHCIVQIVLEVEINVDVSILMRYIACHAKRYYVGDLLVFGTPNALTARSTTGHFKRNVHVEEADSPYSLVVTSSGKTTVTAYALHLNHNPFDTTDLAHHVKEFVTELLDVAKTDYHRDVLWSRLLYSGKQLDIQTQIQLPPEWADEVEIRSDQLDECLALSVRTSFEEIDPILGELLDIPVPWTDFTKLLQNVHAETMREYQFEQSRHVLLMCVGARDIMIHIHHRLGNDAKQVVEMEICRREEPPNGQLSYEQRKTLRDFVNHIVYWLWTHVR